MDYPLRLTLSPAYTRMSDDYLDITRQMRLALRYVSIAQFHTQTPELFEDGIGIPLLAPEELALELLRRFAMTGKRDDALYNDLLGMLKVQAPSLDVAKMRKLRDDDDLLALAFDDAGIAA